MSTHPAIDAYLSTEDKEAIRLQRATQLAGQLYELSLLVPADDNEAAVIEANKSAIVKQLDALAPHPDAKR